LMVDSSRSIIKCVYFVPIQLLMDLFFVNFYSI